MFGLEAPMTVQQLGWLGTRTDRYHEMVTFYRDVLGLRLVHEVPDFAVFELPTGDHVEVFGPGDRDHTHFATGPVAGFLVDDIAAARARLEAAGIEFFGPTHTAEDGYAWAHFRAPDGNVYELTYVP